MEGRQEERKNEKKWKKPSEKERVKSLRVFLFLGKLGRLLIPLF